MPIRLAQVGALGYDSAHVRLPSAQLEFQHLFPDETAWACHLERIRWARAARLEALPYREFYEGAYAHTNPAESDEPVLTG